MSNISKKKIHIPEFPMIIGAGLVVLDIILNNSSKTPIFNAGGTCGNVLAGLSFLGWRSKSVSRAGKDFASDILIKDLLSDGVNVDYITREEKLNTPRIVEKINSNGLYAKHNFFLRCPTCNSYLPRFQRPRIDFINDILKKDENPEVFFFDRVTPSILKLAKAYKKSGALIFFEPYDLRRLEELEESIHVCHILKFSKNSNSKNVDNLINDNSILKKIKSYKPNLVIQTLREKGLLYNYFDNDKWHYKKGKKLKKVYDTCGAGDWLTVGFLFYLQKLAFKNCIKLIEALESIELVKSALDFSQMLASLSSMYVGARGLSKLLERDKILNITETCVEKNCEIISPVKPSLKSKSQIGYVINKRIPEGDYCPTCLLNI